LDEANSTRGTPFRFLKPEELTALSVDERIAYLHQAVEEARREAERTLIPAEKASEKGARERGKAWSVPLLRR
jgi:hypothetical protein